MSSRNKPSSKQPFEKYKDCESAEIFFHNTSSGRRATENQKTAKGVLLGAGFAVVPIGNPSTQDCSRGNLLTIDYNSRGRLKECLLILSRKFDFGFSLAIFKEELLADTSILTLSMFQNNTKLVLRKMAEKECNPLTTT